jgi:hypothetical protein
MEEGLFEFPHDIDDTVKNLYSSCDRHQKPILEDNYMETAAIIQELDNLPAFKCMIIAEQIIRSIRLANQGKTLEIAADRLYDYYKNDKELTIFTQLDGEDFYEPR